MGLGPSHACRHGSDNLGGGPDDPGGGSDDPALEVWMISASSGLSGCVVATVVGPDDPGFGPNNSALLGGVLWSLGMLPGLSGPGSGSSGLGPNHPGGGPDHPRKLCHVCSSSSFPSSILGLGPLVLHGHLGCTWV